MFNAYWEALDFDLPPSPAAASPAGSDGSTRRENRPRTSWMRLPLRWCAERNTAWRRAPWRCCLREPMTAPACYRDESHAGINKHNDVSATQTVRSTVHERHSQQHPSVSL